VPAGTKFCPNCGANLGAPSAAGLPPPPPPAAPAPTDIRQRVDDDRGILKRLQLLVPGFRGYRIGEDIRAADSLLRIQVADKVHLSVAKLQDTRTAMAQAGQFQPLNDVAPALSDLIQLEGHIRQAEQGYTGISPAVRMKPENLDRLYEYDYGFAQAADQLSQGVDALATAARSGDAAALGAAASSVRAEVQQLTVAFQARVQVVEQIRIAG
jgi:hypothetical protein